MTTQDFSTNRNRIIKLISSKVTYKNDLNTILSGTMNKMIKLLNNPLYADLKSTMANIDKITAKAYESYIKHDYNPLSTQAAREFWEDKIAADRKSSMPSSLQR